VCKSALRLLHGLVTLLFSVPPVAFRVPKSCYPRFPTELLPFVFIILSFLSFLASQTVEQTKRPFITVFLTAGHYLITTSGSHIVCWRLFKVLNGRRRNEETYNSWRARVRRASVGNPGQVLRFPVLKQCLLES
jgi:hypothetical protein